MIPSWFLFALTMPFNESMPARPQPTPVQIAAPRVPQAPKAPEAPEAPEAPRADSVALENAYVKVWRGTAACGAANTPGFGTRVIVALTRVTLQSSKGALALDRGQVAVFRADESYGVPTGDYFEVAFRTSHPDVKGPDEWLEPTKNTMVYEDDYLRVFEERLAGGDQRPVHSHAQRVVVRLNEVQLTDPRTNPNPRPGTGIQVPNTVRFAEPLVHAVKNMSAGELFNIVLELKVSRQP